MNQVEAVVDTLLRDLASLGIKDVSFDGANLYWSNTKLECAASKNGCAGLTYYPDESHVWANGSCAATTALRHELLHVALAKTRHDMDAGHDDSMFWASLEKESDCE